MLSVSHRAGSRRHSLSVPPLDNDPNKSRQSVPYIPPQVLLPLLKQEEARRTDRRPVQLRHDVPLRVRQRRREALHALRLLAQQPPHPLYARRAADAPPRALGREHLEDERDVLADEGAVRLDAEREVRRCECLARAVRVLEAVDELVRLERAAERERGGQERGRAGEAGEVDDADRVREREARRAALSALDEGVEVAGVEAGEVGERLLDERLDLVLVAEADAGGDGLVCRVRRFKETVVAISGQPDVEDREWEVRTSLPLSG